jgi:hypothetical protein
MQTISFVLYTLSIYISPLDRELIGRYRTPLVHLTKKKITRAPWFLVLIVVFIPKRWI